MTIREPQRPLSFALAALIHVGLFWLLLSERHSPLESPEERRTVLVFLEDAPKSQSVPAEAAPTAPPRRRVVSPPQDTAPTLIAPPQDETTAPPFIDWRREAEEVARQHALEAEANRPQDPAGAPKPKPEFGWSHSRTHRVEPMENGGFVVWINDKCGVAISIVAMPFCQFGKKPARGDLFEHMDDPATPGDWKDD